MTESNVVIESLHKLAKVQSSISCSSPLLATEHQLKIESVKRQPEFVIMTFAGGRVWNCHQS